MKSLITLFALLGAGMAGAGTISGSGGNIQLYLDNPWYVEYTGNKPTEILPAKVVSYCIDHDPSAFSLGDVSAEVAITNVFRSLKRHFRDWEKHFHADHGPDRTNVKVATQEFKLETCTEDTMLRFQLGKLSSEQKSSLGDPTKWVGAAVLQEYDLKTMQGKGFIYLGADSGELKMNIDDMADSPWSTCEGQNLTAVLMHEVAHVFGIRHNFFGRNIVGGLGFMDENFPKLVIESSKHCEENLWDDLLYSGSRFYANHLGNSQKLQVQRVVHQTVGSSVHRLASGIEPLIWSEPGRDSMSIQYQEVVPGEKPINVYIRLNEVVDAQLLSLNRATRDYIGIVLPEEQRVFPEIIRTPYQFIVKRRWQGFITRGQPHKQIESATPITAESHGNDTPLVIWRKSDGHQHTFLEFKPEYGISSRLY